MSAITLENVTKAFGSVRAVDGVSLEIEKGELFFLLGPSGCGKTTLLRLLAGFYFPDEGRLLLDGADVSYVSPHKRNTGMVFQNYALWPHMNVRQNLTFGLEMRHVPTEERRPRVDRALEMVRMSEYAERSTNQLSGGQQQRVALGRALVLEPDVVLMDEPLSNLDAKLRLEMREHITRIHETLGLTMVYVTHDQSEALSMADRIAVMSEGRIVQVGSPREIYSRPTTRFVAGFIGEANMIPGKIVSLRSNAGVPPATSGQSGSPITAEIETPSGPLHSNVVYEGAAEGDAVLCSIRPERLNVLDDGQTRTNTLSGEVLRAVYLGYHEQYFIRLADGTELKAFESNIDLPKARMGETATVGCDPEDVVLLPENG